MKRDIKPKQIVAFKDLLDVIGEGIELDRREVDKMLGRLQWPKKGKSAVFLATTTAVQNMHAPLQPVVVASNAPNIFSAHENVLAFMLMGPLHTLSQELEMQYGIGVLPSGRRVLSYMGELVLDSGGKDTKARITGELFFGGNSRVSELLTHLVRTFPSMDEHGETCRRRGLANLAVTAPS